MTRKFSELTTRTAASVVDETQVFFVGVEVDASPTSLRMAAPQLRTLVITTDSVTTAAIAASSVTYAKIQNVSATDRVLGRSTAGAGVIEEITCTAYARTLLDDGDQATARTTLGVGAGNAPVFANVASAVYAIVDGGSVDINPANGGIQTWTLGASRTPTASSFASGQAVTLMINDGTAFAVTWSTIGVVWVGGSAPTLPTSGYAVIELWKVGSTVYGAHVGDVA